MPHMRRYLVIGGTVLSRHDGDRHQVGPRELCRLYGIDPSEAILLDSDDDPRGRGLRHEDFVVLRPRYEGDYVEERRRREADAGR
jgi:hypothetical protein